MNEVVVSVKDEINRLHAEIEDMRARCNSVAGGLLKKAIEIGEMLTDKKNALKHGEWLPWLKENVRFDRMTACRYMNVYANQSKCNTVLHLTEAYRLLAGPKQKEETEEETEMDSEQHGDGDEPDHRLDGEFKLNMTAAKDAIAAIKRIVPGTKGSYEAKQKVCVCLQRQWKNKPTTEQK